MRGSLFELFFIGTFRKSLRLDRRWQLCAFDPVLPTQRQPVIFHRLIYVFYCLTRHHVLMHSTQLRNAQPWRVIKRLSSHSKRINVHYT